MPFSWCKLKNATRTLHMMEKLRQNCASSTSGQRILQIIHCQHEDCRHSDWSLHQILYYRGTTNLTKNNASISCQIINTLAIKSFCNYYELCFYKWPQLTQTSTPMTMKKQINVFKIFIQNKQLYELQNTRKCCYILQLYKLRVDQN